MDKWAAELLDLINAIPNIPQDVRGITYASKCPCGGTIRATRSTYNGHMRAACDKCSFRMME